MKHIASTLTSWMTASFAAVALAPVALALTPQETVSLQFMKQEEKLARDVYQTLAARWEHPTFPRIAAAEQRHLSAVESLLRRYQVADPSPAEPGRYSFPELQTLHDALVAEGAVSLTDALKVGVTIEETDRADLAEALTQVQATDIATVFQNLYAASGRHLNAFQTALGNPTDPSQTCGAGAGAGACTNAEGCPTPGRGRGNPSCAGQGQGKGSGQGAKCGTGRGQGAGPAAEGACPLGNGQGCQGQGVGARRECSKAGANTVTELPHPNPTSSRSPVPSPGRVGRR